MDFFEAMIQKSSRIASPQKKVLGIAGSPRKGGNSDVLLEQILSGVEAEKAVSGSFQLRELDYRGCVGCERCRKNKICTRLKDGMSLIYPELMDAKGLILISPTHNYNITAWVKAFIDRLYCFYDFDTNCPRGWSSRLAGQGRKAVLGAICEQESIDDMGFTLEAMRLPLEAHGYEIIEEIPVFKVFAKAKIKDDETVMAAALLSGKKLAKSL